MTGAKLEGAVFRKERALQIALEGHVRMPDKLRVLSVCVPFM